MLVGTFFLTLVTTDASCLTLCPFLCSVKTTICWLQFHIKRKDVIDQRKEKASFTKVEKLNCSFKLTANFPIPLPNWVNSFWHTNKTNLNRLETLLIRVVHQSEQIWRLPTFLYQCQILFHSWAENILIKTCDVNQLLLLLSYLECQGASENNQKTISKVVTISSCIVLLWQITIIEEELKINKTKKKH